MNGRIKAIRKETRLTQEEFALRLGFSSKGTISALESGAREITDRVIKQICTEFNVNEHWLRTGDGEMFDEALTDVVDQLADKYNLSELEKILIMEYGSLNDGQKQMFRQFFKKVIGKLSEEDVATAQPEIKPVAIEKEDNKEVKPKKYIPVSTDAEIEAELEAYRKELEAEKRARLASQKSSRKEIG